MTSVKSTFVIAALVLSFSTVSIAGTITGSRTNSVGIITGSRVGTITGSATGTITGSRTGTMTGSPAGTTTDSRTSETSADDDSLISKIAMLLLSLGW
jgi:outer membrane lipoprotein SlyB